ncbi:MAG: hypothetical protein RL341_1537 [Pseudomonadota bacterium]|jgi:hypothetical protein
MTDVSQIKAITVSPVDTKAAIEEQQFFAKSATENGDSDEKIEKRAVVESLKNDSLRLQNQSFAQNIDERKTYAGRIFWLIVGWLIGLAVLLLAQGFGRATGNFEMSDSVAIAIVSGTTVNVLGIFVFVAKYLFPAQLPVKKPKNNRDIRKTEKHAES